MPTRLITAAELERELSPQIFLLVFDTENTGTANTAEGSLCDDIIMEASSAVLGALGGAFDLESLKTESSADRLYEVKRLTRRIARAYVAMRSPEVLRISIDDAFKMEQKAIDQLKRIRENETQLDATTPAPANVGGVIQSDVGGKPRWSLNSDGFGDY